MDKQQREYIHHLMLQYSDAMVRLTYRRVGDWHLAEDLVQETFLTAFDLARKPPLLSYRGFD